MSSRELVEETVDILSGDEGIKVSVASWAAQTS
jgi:hypothetical protein